MAMEKQFDIVIILSGTEPQRTILEHKILIQLAGLPYKVFLVQGLPAQNQHLRCSSKLEIVSFLKGDELNPIIESANLVISRSGYTTIMDLAVLGKKALLIPTPGQKEQEILARHFHKQGIFYGVDQDEIDLGKNVAEAMNFTGMKIDSNQTSGKEMVMKAWLQKSNLFIHKLEETIRV
jgi:predicted glycosyltransferase